MGRVARSIMGIAFLGTISACSMQALREEFPVLGTWSKPSNNSKTESAAAVNRGGDGVADVVKYYQLLGTLTPDQLRAEWEENKRQFEKDRDEGSRLRLAMLTLRPGTDYQNLTLAGELLRDYRERAATSRDRDALGVFLSDMVAEQLKLLELKRMAIAQLEKVQEQINALKNIEQNIHERELRDSSTKKR